jgi:glycosyltransferase involved in cell wall biosynthesis
MARILLIRVWYYPVDSRVSREVQALVRAGHQVDIVCAAKPGQPRIERNGAITVRRLPIERRRAGLARYLFEFVAFQIAATFTAAALHLRRRYDLVQVHSLPDWLVFAAIVPKLLGARVLLDLHECMPEYFMTKYRMRSDHPAVRVLEWLEQASIAFADAVITCTEQMRARFVERGAPREKVSVVLNSFDEDHFDPRRFPRSRNGTGPFVLICHGTIDENYGIDLAIRAVALLRDRIPSLRLEIYGDGTHRAALKEMVGELGLDDIVWLSDGFVPVEDLLPRIADADVGVVAIRRDAFRDLTHCNKMYDLVAMGRPVVISRTSAVQAYFGDDCFQMFESGDERDLARAIYELYADPAKRERLPHRAREVGEPYRWIHQRDRYIRVVEGLVGAGVSVPAAPVIAEAGEKP